MSWFDLLMPIIFGHIVLNPKDYLFKGARITRTAFFKTIIKLAVFLRPLPKSSRRMPRGSAIAFDVRDKNLFA